MDPSSLFSQGVTQSEAGLGNGGLNQGGSGLPFKCKGIDQVRPSLGSQLQKPKVETTNQFQILSPQLVQQVLQQQELQRQRELQRLRQDLWRLEQERQQWLEQERLDAARLLLARSRGGSSSDDNNGIESLKVRSKRKEKLSSNTLSPVENDFDHSDEMRSDEVNLIGSRTPKVKSKCSKKRKSSVWKFYKRITEKDGKERVQCKKCVAKYLIDSKTIGTSTLRRHVEKCSRNEAHGVGQLEPKDQGPEPIQEENIIEARTPERPCVPQGHWSGWIYLTCPASGQSEPKDQGPEPIQEENIIETRTPERPCVPQAHIGSAVQSASGVLGTTPAVTTERRQLAEMHTESDKSIWSKTSSAFRPTSHDSANKSAGTEADEGKSSTTPAATVEEVQAPRDLQPSLATTKSGPQEESGSIHKQFASAEELGSIGEQKKALKITLNRILDSLSKGQIECLGRCEIAVDVVLSTVGSAVDVKALEAIFTELFASSKEWHSIQDPASLYQNEVLDRRAILRREFAEALENEEKWTARHKQMQNYMEKIRKHKEIILSSLEELGDLEGPILRRELDEKLEFENEEQSSWIDGDRRLMMLHMDKSLERGNNLLKEAADRVKGFEARVAFKFGRLMAFESMVDGILGASWWSFPEVAAQKYAAHKKEAMKAQLQDFSGKINDFFKE